MIVVDADQRPLAALAALVDFAGHEFLARAGLAENQHAGVGGRDEFNLPRNGVQSGALPDEAAERAGFQHFFSKIRVFEFELARAFEFRDVQTGADVADDAAIFAPFRGHVDKHPAARAVHVLQSKLHFQIRTGLLGRAAFFQHALTVVRVKGLQPAVAESGF